MPSRIVSLWSGISCSSYLFSSTPMARALLLAVSTPFRTPETSLHQSLDSKALLSTSSLSTSKVHMFRIQPHRFWLGKYSDMSRNNGTVYLAEREYRKMPGHRGKKKEMEIEIDVKICIEEQLPDDSEILDIAEMLRLNVPMAMKLAFDGLCNAHYKTRVTAIKDVGGFEKAELSVLLCNDQFIHKLNKEWRNEDHVTDVLSMSQHIPELNIPILMLGDIVVSVETALRQARERGHTLLDEIRILMVHGLLHLLGFDHEISEEAETEMEAEEELLLRSLGWKGRGLIQSSYNTENGDQLYASDSDRKQEESLRFYRPKFKYIFCDMDGTLLNRESQISSTTARAMKELLSRGINVVIATGKPRAGALSILKTADLVGRHGIISEFSPGIFLQGLLVYGKGGQEIFRRNLERNVCREALVYSSNCGVPVVAYSSDRCFTLFDHPLVDSLHTIYHEPKAEIIPSIDRLLAITDMQKLLLLDSVDGVANTLRPYWEAAAAGGRARVVQALPDMLEIVPPGASKGAGIRMLIDHLGVASCEIMAIGDGENDVEMLQLAGLGVALSNGSDKVKAAADVIGLSNDEDGVVDAIYRYAF